MSHVNTRSRGAYRGLCTRYFNEAKTIMDSASITTYECKRLSQIITLMEKRLSEIQALASQIHAILEIDEIEAAMTTSADFNDQIFINIDTIKRFLQNFNQSAESTGDNTASSSHTVNSNANRINTRLPKLNFTTFSGNYKNWTSFFDLFTKILLYQTHKIATFEISNNS